MNKIQEVKLRISVIPWRSFSYIKHTSTACTINSIPELVFGKIFENTDKYYMPVSVEAHHALVDGYHVCDFFNQFEKSMTKS